MLFESAFQCSHYAPQRHDLSVVGRPQALRLNLPHLSHRLRRFRVRLRGLLDFDRLLKVHLNLLRLFRPLRHFRESWRGF